MSTINLDTITEISERLPAGTYVGRLSAVEGKKSQAGKPMLQAVWEIVKGDCEGQETRTFYSLAVTTGKDGKTYASGIVEAKRIFAALGSPLEKNYGFPLDENVAAQLFHKKAKGKNVKLLIFDEPAVDRVTKQPILNDDGTQKKFSRTKVVGPASSPVAVAEAAAGVAPAADEFDS